MGERNECDIFQHDTIGEIKNEGHREEEINQEQYEESKLVKDPKYCVPTTKASLEGRDPSKSGGGEKR